MSSLAAACTAASPPQGPSRSAPRLAPRRPRRALRARASAGGSDVREVLSSVQRSKLDLRPDGDFYRAPRLVHHLDAGFRAQLTELYRQQLPAGADVLDLCSSWVSHLPRDVRYGRVVGHGMNAAELGRNPQLTEFVVRDLNRQPAGWAFADASFDAVLCCASVQYLQQPEAVLREARRVLRPGGVAIIAFSNRMFYEKAIAAWRDNSDYGRCLLVKSYFAAVGGFDDPEVVKRVQLPGGGAPSGSPLERAQQWAQQLLGGGGGGDPFFAVVARRLADE